MKVSQQHFDALSAVCDAFLPPIADKNDVDGYMARKASDLQVAEYILGVFGSLPPEQQSEMRQLLGLLDSRLLGLSWGGPRKRVAELTLAEREAMLQSWAHSRIGLLRKSFASLKKLSTFVYYARSVDGKQNPNWKSIGYPRPEIAPAPHPGLNVVKVSRPAYFTCETVVVGSGAGGGVVAGILAQSGQDVMVVEKGRYLRSEQMNGREGDMINTLFERCGAMSNVDGNMAVLAGSCLGGGTTVNWAGSFRTPDYVLHEWAREHHNPQFVDPAYAKCFEAVESRLNVNADYTGHNPQNRALERGAERLGYKIAPVPQNVRRCGKGRGCRPGEFCPDCSYGTLGDAVGCKQDMLRTYLHDASEAGARLLPDMEVDLVLVERGKAVGVLGYAKDESGGKHEVVVRAGRVVVAAGAIHTPALLMRSGLRHKQIGKNLYLHPVVPVAALYEEDIRSWRGPMMSMVCDEFTRLDGNYGFKIETPPLHAGFTALAMPWKGGERFKRKMLEVGRTGMFIPLVRDRFGGSISLGKDGQPLLRYKISRYDMKHLLRGMQECAKLHRAAGALKIYPMHNDADELDARSLTTASLMDIFAKKKWQANHFGMYSAHQMGTCRMGGNRETHPCKPSGETWEVGNLFVADASLFPHCSGANPMLSIQALACYIANNLV